jgi:uroporphyrinogen decarboxylase
MSTMTELERFRAFLAREPLDRPLRYAHYTGPLLEKVKQRLGGRDPHEFFNNDDGRTVRHRPPEGFERPDTSRYYDEPPPREELDELGIWRQQGDFYHFRHIVSPLRNARSLEEIERYPICAENGWCEDHMAAEVEQAHAEGRYAQGHVGHIYENSWQVRGNEQFLMDLVLRPDWAESIVERITRRNINRATALARAGVDLIKTGDDIANQKAMMFSPELWRRVFKPRWKRVYDAARAIKPDVAIWYHSDGNPEPVIEDLIEIGVTILNPLQPECMDIEGVGRRFGDRLLFDGAVGTQSTFPWGTPEQMREVVAERRRVFGDTLVLSPTHVLEPEVPVENIVAFFEAVDGRDYPLP